MKKLTLTLFLVIAAQAITTQANAQTSTPEPFKLGDVTVTGSLRDRVYAWDWFEPSAGYNGQYGYSGNILRLNFSEKLGAFDWDAEIAVPFILGLPRTATAPAPQGALGLGSNYYGANGNQRNTVMAFPKQLFGRYKFGAKESQSVAAGRLEVNDGAELASKDASLQYLKANRISQRLIGTFGFSDVGRSFDGVRYSVTQANQDLTVLAVTPTRGVFQTDGWGWNRVAMGYAAYTKETSSTSHSSDTRLFFIDYDDFRDVVLKTDNRATAARKADLGDIHIQTYGGNTEQVFKTAAGTFDALGWVAVQTGAWGSLTQRAWAEAAEAGYQPAILPKLKPWLRGGYDASSGDGNPNDNTHDTFFQIVPTPRIYARTPFYNMMNIEDAFGSLVLRPHSKVTISSEFHSLRLTNPNDLWYSGGGVYQPWSFGYTGRAVSGKRSLANLWDTQLEYRQNRHFTLTAYFGYAQGKAVMQQIYPAGKDMRFGYLEAMYRL